MSEILFLGTGAADWSLEDKGGFFRRNSAALINCDLMIDCGKHIFDFAESENEKSLYANITDIIITHRHSDHFCRDSVLKLAETNKLRVGCDNRIMQTIGAHPNIEYVNFKPFQTTNMGRYKITPLLANHDIVFDGNACAFHYIIETFDDRKLFYGLDGAWFLRPSWQEMQKHKFDTMIFDCTVGDRDDWRMFEHNTIPMLRVMINEIRNKQMINPDGTLIASHMAKELHISHEDTEEILKRINVLTAYDGMRIVF